MVFRTPTLNVDANESNYRALKSAKFEFNPQEHWPSSFKGKKHFNKPAYGFPAQDPNLVFSHSHCMSIQRKEMNPNSCAIPKALHQLQAKTSIPIQKNKTAPRCREGEKTIPPPLIKNGGGGGEVL
ncbi:hypothetical protein CEXT_750191 [Caerostris extrusa]|uniref:Uncharacterized protein n=1 Tax=Caerostris extrusa TaxID=172846 RepID=A0AAV4NTN3_CAEEX|nr:hypothetical protein CEXT_750191 [Caerostris extrusa]